MEEKQEKQEGQIQEAQIQEALELLNKLGREAGRYLIISQSSQEYWSGFAWGYSQCRREFADLFEKWGVTLVNGKSERIERKPAKPGPSEPS